MTSKQKLTLRGTIAELAGRVFVNGQPVGQPELSVLTRLGNGTFAKPVERVTHKDANGKPTKGRPTTVWEIDQNIRMRMEQGEPAQDAAVPAEQASAEQAAEGEAMAAAA